MTSFRYQILILFIVLALILPNFIFAEENLEETCQSMEKIEGECQTLSATACRQLLEKCGQYYEEKSAQIEKDISKTQKEKETLQNKINILKNEINNLNYQISQSNLMIKDLGYQIQDTESSIEETSLKIKDSHQQLADILQLIYEGDQKSMIEILLSEKELSGFFDDLMQFEALNAKNQELLENTKNLKSYLEDQKESLDEEKDELENLVKVKTLQQQESQATKKEQEYFLKLTEAEYQKHLQEKKETEKRAAEIKTRIFELIGVPEAPTFGEAYEIAKFVSDQTGIRPALLLAVLTQESNIGKNVGQCYLVNSKTGEGVRATSGKKEPKTMNPTRDVPQFFKICEELGRDPYNTLVSCPMSIGWGGAMGPSQFIPSTWALYKDKVSAITGKAADPWNIKDAFLATGIYLKNLGGTQNEFKAVMQYFSGAGWYKWEEFYGRSVLSIAAQYEDDIKQIEGI